MPICQIVLKAGKPLNSAYPLSLRTIGDHIKKRRVSLGLTQKAVANLISVNECTVTNWEKNYSHPRIKYMPQILDFLGYIPNICPCDSLGDKIILYRHIHGLSQKKLATKNSIIINKSFKLIKASL